MQSISTTDYTLFFLMSLSTLTALANAPRLLILLSPRGASVSRLVRVAFSPCVCVCVCVVCVCVVCVCVLGCVCVQGVMGVMCVVWCGVCVCGVCVLWGVCVCVCYGVCVCVYGVLWGVCVRDSSEQSTLYVRTILYAVKTYSAKHKRMLQVYAWVYVCNTLVMIIAY